MSLKIYRGRPIWAPENITRLQDFALKWRPLGNIASLAVPMSLIPCVGVLIIPLFATPADWSTARPILLATGCVAVLDTIILVLNGVATHVRKGLQTNPAFRFSNMQDETPSFKVLGQFNTMNKVSLSPKQRYALDAWLETHWKRDHDPVPPFATWDTHTEWLCAELEDRIKTFRDLPLHFPNNFDAASDDLLKEHHERWAEQLEEHLNSLKEHSEQTQAEVLAAEHKLTQLRDSR